MALTATPGASNANSYATLAEATAYAEAHVSGATWLALEAVDDAGDNNGSGVDQQERALQMATRLLDQWYEWCGYTASSTQALLWPRAGVVGPSGYLIANDTIPVLVRDAACELARTLIGSDRTADLDVEVQGLDSLKVGSIEMKFKGAASTKAIPNAVMAMVSPLGTLRGASGGAVSVRRG